jgi:PAS domain S-box-containing protein
VLSASTVRAWIATLGAAGGIAMAYFLVARLGLTLLSTPSDVAVFWPAAGVAAGILIISGRRARPALVIGVVVGTIAANILSDRSLLTSIFKGFCNAGEAVLLAWLVERWFGIFTFGDLRRVAGFLAAASLAAATSAVGGATTMTLLHTAAPFWEIWRTWFLSDGVGIVIVAPVLIGVAQSWRERPTRGELIEGIAVVGLLASVTLYVVSCPTSSWVSFCLGAFVLPLLLWLAARCQPAFAMVGTFVVSIIVIYATTFGIGHFGDEAIPIMERAKGTQAAVMMVTIYTLVLTALLTERRSREEGLRRLLEALPAAIQTTDTAGRITYCNQAAVELWGKRPVLGKDTRHNLYRLFYPDGTPMPDAKQPCQVSLRDRRTVRGQEAILERADGKRLTIIPCPSPLFDEAGKFVGIVNMHLDISERKLVETRLAERNAQLDLAGKIARIGSFSYDQATETLQISPGLAVMHGLRESTLEISREQWRALVHPDDLAPMDSVARGALVNSETELVLEFRILRRGEVRWIESRMLISYDEARRPVRRIGAMIDVTERKLAAATLAEREAQLALAGKTGLVGSYAYDADTEVMQISAGCAAIHGYPEGTAEIPRSEWLAGVHRDDVKHIHARRSAAFRERRPNFNTEYRIIRPDGEIRWVETRTFVFYNDDGRPRRVAGVNIDVTERKQQTGRTDIGRAQCPARPCPQGRARRLLHLRHLCTNHAIFALQRGDLRSVSEHHGANHPTMVCARAPRRYTAAARRTHSCIQGRARRTHQ